MNNTTTAPCMRCGGDAKWTVGHVFDTDLYGDIHVCHAFVCDGCGTTVREKRMADVPAIRKTSHGIGEGTSGRE